MRHLWKSPSGTATSIIATWLTFSSITTYCQTTSEWIKPIEHTRYFDEDYDPHCMFFIFTRDGKNSKMSHAIAIEKEIYSSNHFISPNKIINTE